MKQIHGRYLLQPNKDFPADCEMLDYLQTNAHVVSIIGNLAGDKAVLLGCAPMDNGARRAEGYVFLHTREHPEGEVLFWEGGAVGTIRRHTPSGHSRRVLARKTTAGKISARPNRCPRLTRSWPPCARLSPT